MPKFLKCHRCQLHEETIARREAANAALGAALERLAVTDAGPREKGERRCAGCGYPASWARHAEECFVNAALSDTAGEGWLPPEVREQATRYLESARGKLAKGMVRDLVDSALAALGGK